MKKYRIAVFARNRNKAYINERESERAKECPLNGTWTLEELQEKNAGFRNWPEGWEPRIPRDYRDFIDLSWPHQGLYAVVQEITGE